MATPEMLNRWRVIPRLMMMLYGWLCVEVFLWFTALAEPSNAQGAFAGAIIAAGALWFQAYVNSGGKGKVDG